MFPQVIRCVLLHVNVMLMGVPIMAIDTPPVYIRAIFNFVTALKLRGCVSSPALSLDIDENGFDLRLLRGYLHNVASLIDYRLVRGGL